MKLQTHNNKLVAFHINNKNDYGYLLDQGPINSIQLEEELCHCAVFSKVNEKSVLVRTVPTIVIAHMFCASRDSQDSYG